MPKLKSDLHAKITALSEAGDDLAKAGNHAGAIKKYDEALALVPSPRLSYEAATWLLVAKGDVYFSTKKWAAAAGAFGEAVYGFGGNENPFVHLRFGQAQFELGSISRSLQSLARAFMLDGEKVFEDEDPRYLSFVRLHLKPPSGNKWPKAGLEVIADAAVAAELASKAEKETVRAVAARVARFVEKQRLAALAVAYQNGTIFDVPLLAARLAGEPVAWTPRDINHVGGDKLGLDDQPLAAVAGGLALVSPDVWADARSIYVKASRALRDQLATTVAVAEGFIVYATDIDGKETIENLQRGFGDALVGTLREDGALASLERGKSSRKKR